MKDLKLALKRGYDLNELSKVVNLLANRKTLPINYKDHALSGDYSNFRECHIKPDWLLIYHIDDEELELFLLRTGTHSDLF
jgi:mRNA interferase YafQ